MRKEDLELLEVLVDELEIAWERSDDGMEGFILEKMEQFFDRLKLERKESLWAGLKHGPAHGNDDV